jgi:hypothetical protein
LLGFHPRILPALGISPEAECLKFGHRCRSRGADWVNKDCWGESVPGKHELIRVRPWFRKSDLRQLPVFTIVRFR